MSATTAALTAAVMTVAVALPAAASTTTNGGTSVSEQQTQTSSSDQRARTADYRPVTATWYGPGLYGNRLACGGRLTHSTLGVAHRRLPCGSKVALRYKGRTIVVPVIDRGPYSRGVSYDLTQATARKLGMAQTSRVGAAPLGR